MLQIQIAVAFSRKSSSSFDASQIFIGNIPNEEHPTFFLRNLIPKCVIGTDGTGAISSVFVTNVEGFLYLNFFEPRKGHINSVIFSRNNYSRANINYFCSGIPLISINKRDSVIFILIKFCPIENECSGGNFWAMRGYEFISPQPILLIPDARQYTSENGENGCKKGDRISYQPLPKEFLAVLLLCGGIGGLIGYILVGGRNY
jgi:hypothetical protein